MPKFFHVTRTNLSGIDSFQLGQFDNSIAGEYLYSSQDFKSSIRKQYPDGIAKHGEIFLLNTFQSTGPNQGFTDNEFLIEMTFELVRKLKFPERNSRFTVSFGCLNLEDAKRLREITFDGEGEIFEVECDRYFKADMSFLRQGGSIIGMEIMAEKYWSGKSSGNPFWEVLMEYPVKILNKIE
ncbi:hypothetical protein [Autumnicola musiva]|uniref:DUF2441 domain-containing protein n=1 Tax=Autumnicola musiva TaxID=3075589 RepID=A0ABU3D703_9FLAO|nr:hypothetical protein [Zunongwangia sp. F117]MDT0677297.1 hypothetical protein [Zunongwangia sp. F117]